MIEEWMKNEWKTHLKAISKLISDLYISTFPRLWKSNILLQPRKSSCIRSHGLQRRLPLMKKHEKASEHRGSFTVLWWAPTKSPRECHGFKCFITRSPVMDKPRKTSEQSSGTWSRLLCWFICQREGRQMELSLGTMTSSCLNCSRRPGPWPDDHYSELPVHLLGTKVDFITRNTEDPGGDVVTGFALNNKYNFMWRTFLWFLT